MQCFIRLFTPLLVATTLLATNVNAQSQGTDTISFVVPYAAGGTLGAAAVARAQPNARTVLLASTSALTIGPNLRKVSYDPIQGFTPILGAAVGPVAILATRDAPFQDFKGMLDYAKANPGAVRYATPGVGSVAHLALEGLQLRAKIALTHVPYRGESPAIQDALGGVTELLVVNTPTVLQHVQAGALRALAVLEPQRLLAWPKVPTLTEVGFDKLEYSSDFGVFVPATMPEAARAKVSDMFQNAVASKEFKQILDNLSLLPGSAQGEQYAAKIADEHQRNAEIIKVRNITSQ